MNSVASDEHWMRRALELARRAEHEGEVPIGAVLVRDDKLISEAWNRSIGNSDPTAHAEIMVLRAAGKTELNYRLTNTTLYVTLEPCPMCAGALVHARVKRVVYGTADPRTGAAGSVFDLLRARQLNHQCEVDSGILQEACAEVLESFFRNKR